MPPQQHGHQQTRYIAQFTDPMVILPPPPAKYTLQEWHLNKILRDRICLDQQRLADSIICDTDRVIDEVHEKTDMNKKEVDHAIDQKLKDLEFTKGESERQRKEVCKETESLTVYCERIRDCLHNLEQNALRVVNKCLIQRERRIGIDYCYDSVDRELKKEYQVIEGVMALLTRTLEQGHEQLRRLRSTFYFMDRDLEDKSGTTKIELLNKSLTHTTMNLSIYHGFAPLDPSNITLQEWEKFSIGIIENSAKEIAAARQLRVYVDTLLRQANDDLIFQYNATNNAIRIRIEELKESKKKMEVQHSEVMRQVNEVGLAIGRLHKSLTEKEGYLGLAHTRLGNRAQRQGVELCKDIVELSLVKEVADLRANCALLQHKLAEAEASQRYLLKTQLQLEEDINLNTNTLKIDEVDCMTLRQGMEYHPF